MEMFLMTSAASSSKKDEDFIRNDINCMSFPCLKAPTVGKRSASGILFLQIDSGYPNIGHRQANSRPAGAAGMTNCLVLMSLCIFKEC